MIIEAVTLAQIIKPKEIIPQPKPTTTIKVEKKKETKPKKIYYTVKQGDSLTSIARRKKTTVKRLFYKNKSIKNPDQLKINQRIVIPSKTEKLKKRLYILVESKRAKETIERGSGKAIAGNMYEPGQCVWAIKNWRPEIPNTWGSAVSWLSNAQADGWPTGSTPRVGAVGWTNGHVVLITAVNKNGTVDIKDMNGRWVPFEIGYGTYPSSKYLYIY